MCNLACYVENQKQQIADAGYSVIRWFSDEAVSGAVVVVNKNWSQFQIFSSIYFPIRSEVIHRYIHEAGVHYKSVCVNRLLYVAIKPVLVT